MDSRSFLKCLLPAPWLSKPMSGWLKPPRRMGACEHDASGGWSQKASSAGSLDRAPITDPIHKVSFIEVASNSHPRALNLSVALPQRQLFAINPSPNAEGNTPSLGSFQEQAVCDCPAMAFRMATASPSVHFCPQSLCAGVCVGGEGGVRGDGASCGFVVVAGE